MTIRRFIKRYRLQIDDYLLREYNIPSEMVRKDKQRWQAVVNDTGLHLWAKSEGVTNFKWRWLR